MMNGQDVVMDILHNTMGYTPKLRKITGSIENAIALQTMMRLFTQNDSKPFYRFNKPCGNEYYRVGESWLEMFGFTEKELARVKQELVYMVSASKVFTEMTTSSRLVLSWKTNVGLTMYWVNMDEIIRRYEKLS